MAPSLGDIQPEILFLNLLEGTDATSSRSRLLVLDVSVLLRFGVGHEAAEAGLLAG